MKISMRNNKMFKDSEENTLNNQIFLNDLLVNSFNRNTIKFNIYHKNADEYFSMYSLFYNGSKIKILLRLFSKNLLVF